jgi:hypothetical protein
MILITYNLYIRENEMRTSRKSKSKPMMDLSNMISWSSSDVINLPLIPPTARGHYIYELDRNKPIVDTKSIIKPKVVQAKIPVVVGDKSYSSICAMMKGEGIPDQAKQGLDNHWSQIRSGLKRLGTKTWTFDDGRTITITQ